jgi:hypothetical protein
MWLALTALCYTAYILMSDKISARRMLSSCYMLDEVMVTVLGWMSCGGFACRPFIEPSCLHMLGEVANSWPIFIVRNHQVVARFLYDGIEVWGR